MKSYSLDLRERVANDDKSIKKTAALFKVSPDFVWRMRNQKKKTGSLTPKTRSEFRPRKINESGEKWLEKLVEYVPDLTLHELCDSYEKEFAIKVSKSAMDRTCRRLNFTYKKNEGRSATTQ